MTNNSGSGQGLPVVIDEWTVQVWADSKIPGAVAARLVADVDARLVRAIRRISNAVAARGGHDHPWVQIADRSR